MLLAAVGDTPYNIFLFLHIAAMFAAFAPMFVNPFIEAGTRGSPARAAIFGAIAQRSMRIHGTALIVGGLLGFGVAGMSKDANDNLVYEMKDSWLLIAVVVWIAMNGVLHAMIIPGEKAVAGGDESGASKMDIGGKIMTVLFLVTIYLMVFKPGA
ncbi:MAG: hypothetical protein P8L46_07400 [Acidimicrobiales bacterium]|jgi:uncharacterized membrane protein|nr:hypothetical protein [Acidimicrobiales bacterium]MDG2217856.1 hypothetical protein [Acidimicrobiales bacterium]